jgi:hypothetical protein
MSNDGKSDGKQNPILASASDGESKTAKDQVKATFYLRSKTIDALELAWFNLRRISPPHMRSSITKSQIVELALEMVLKEAVEKETESALVKALLKANQK